MKFSNMDRRQKRKWQPFINYILIVLALIVLASLLFGVWRLFMPKTQDDRPHRKLTSAERLLAERLEEDVRFLSEAIGERNMHTPGSMEKTTDWIEIRMKDAGYQPERHNYRIGGIRFGGHTADNLIAEVTGTKQPDEIVVIGAHYDSVAGSPGA
ncbi:MAG: M28 family peptidase, partial [Balneolaceae bacterium]